MDVGAKDAVIPPGTPLTASEASCANPLELLNCTVYVTVCPMITVAESGEAETLKVLAGVTVNGKELLTLVPLFDRLITPVADPAATTNVTEEGDAAVNGCPRVPPA